MSEPLRQIKTKYIILNATVCYLQEDFNSWLTKSISSQSKLFGGKEKVPEVTLTPSEVAPRKEKWRYRNVCTILRRLSALTIDKRWHQVSINVGLSLSEYIADLYLFCFFSDYN